ncbi:thioredoxin domain-containing protein [Hydrogenoanaerobacterium sp.]|uniref:thioredoxin domain-containing protein n=1 Tax=Hydrogenoanaerobacterium sp. TaxID=2953763 RepID=UPI0028A2CFF9|nr:thioredoxin domain-containing protein [Hydrogenoanaerobacterium sp.]
MTIFAIFFISGYTRLKQFLEGSDSTANSNKKSNKLIHEKSPYLLQHAYNPVDWYPWGEEAFAHAKAEDKPIFLSIGYSTCHWCHVMEQESFEDDEVAQALNRNFIAIKVDKEERPDIDSVYMNVCQALTGSGGWPMTILMTPEQKPFFAGTYFPKRSRYNMPGILDILQTVATQWRQDKGRLLDSAGKITGIMKKQEQETGEGRLSKELTEQAESLFAKSFDVRFGGFGSAPKFPTPHNLMFLLRYSALEQDKSALSMVEKTLQQMYKGGLFDHIGFGFSRYSTDRRWLVPHFEKMLYDNALLAIAYLETYQLTGNELYRRVAEKTLTYVLREMTSEDGGFYSAQDADSEGVEGKYYVFTPDEIINLLGEEDGAYFNQYFDITAKGNFEGSSIPNLIENAAYDKADDRIEALCKKVYEYRLTRTALHKDDKILTSWNSLMIVAFAKAYQVLGTQRYREAAERAMEFNRQMLTTEDGRLCVRHRDGESAGGGYLDDYAFTAWAALTLYEATFEANYLEKALFLTQQISELFSDAESGGFYLYGAGSENLILRPKETYDGAIPSGNSVAAYVLIRLAKLTGKPQLEELAHRQLKFLAGSMEHYPAGYSFALMAMISALYTTKEIVCVTENSEDVQKLQGILRSRFLPNTVVLVKDLTGDGKTEQLVELIENYRLKDGKTAYYICENNACTPPFTNLDELAKRL